MPQASPSESDTFVPETGAPAASDKLKLKPARRRLSDDAVLALNLSLFLAAGTVLCVWFWRNSGWFEEFGAVLAFSGGLSWVAVAMKIVPEAKVARLQGAFFERVFENRRALPFHAAALGVVVAGTFCFATVQIEPFHETVERPVVVTKTTDREAVATRWADRLAEEDFEVLQPGQTLRVVVPVWGRWQTRVVVAVGGFPEKTITLSPWQRAELIAPSSFRRPVVLLRPTADFMTEIAISREPRELEVVRKRAGEVIEKRTMPLDGHAIWLGCDEHVEVPELWREAWAREAGWERHLTQWLFPKSLRLTGDLIAGDTLEISVRGPSGVDWQLAEPHLIRPPTARAEFLPDIIKIGK